MSHALSCLAAQASHDQLVVAPHRAIEENQGRAGKPRPQIVRDAGDSRKKIEILARRLVADAEPKRVTRSGVPGGMSLSFKIPRALAGNGERQNLDAGACTVGQCRLERHIGLDRLARYVFLAQYIEDAVGFQDRKYPG